MRATKMPPATFGRAAVGDPNFVFDLKNGREPRAHVTERVQVFMAQHRGRAS